MINRVVYSSLIVSLKSLTIGHQSLYPDYRDSFNEREAEARREASAARDTSSHVGASARTDARVARLVRPCRLPRSRQVEIRGCASARPAASREVDFATVRSAMDTRMNIE